MNIDLQPTLQNDLVLVRPLHENDFETLYKIASDPAIWQQHPNKDRWKKEVFRTFFDGAMESGGAFLVIDKSTGSAIGSSRFNSYDPENSSIFIGYTFYATACWGKGINPMVKKLMLDYIFKFVNKVHFYIGAENVRSQIAITRIGAVKIGEEEVAYFGETPKLNFVYEITNRS